MFKIQKNILISKPAQDIWLILDDPVQSGGLNPSMKLLYFYESRFGGFDRAFRWYIGGKHFEIGTKMSAYICAKHMAYKTCGALQSMWYWWLESDGRQTHVSLTVEYDLPKALADADRDALEQENDQVIGTHLMNLKRAAEEKC